MPREFRLHVTDDNEESATETTSTPAPDMASLKDQHEYVDKNMRTTADVAHYKEMRKSASLLLTLKRELDGRDRLDDFDKVGKRVAPVFSEKYPQFFDYIKKCERHRLEEFRGVMFMMFDNLEKVAEGKMNHTEMREQVFEKNLAQKYYKGASRS